MTVLITGASGFLGQHVVVESKKYNLDILIPSSKELDLTDLNSVLYYFKNNNFDTILHLAAKAGGIGLNQKQPADLTHINLIMATNLYSGIKDNINRITNIYNVGTVCAYPKYCLVPFKEDDLWNGREEDTNNGYSFAKKALLVLGEKYRLQYGLKSVFFLPANLYGPYDHFDLENSHVIPALIRKFIEAKEENKSSVEIWSSGEATREFLHVQDCAEALIKAVYIKFDSEVSINLGTGRDISIKELAKLIAQFVGYTGEIVFDITRPAGQPKRQLDVSRAKELLGFESKIHLVSGLMETIQWYYNYGR